MELLRQIVGQLLDFLRSYADWWARAVAALSNEFDLDLPVRVSEFLGFVLGAIVLVAFLRRLGKWDPKGDKPQPFPLKTTETPNEVVSKDFEKFLGLVLRIALFVLLIVVVVTTR